MTATLTPGTNVMTLKVSDPGRDDLVGMKVWCSTASGFTPNDATLVYSGAGLIYTISGLADGVVCYVRYALISEIDPSDYDISGELSGTPAAPARSVRMSASRALSYTATDGTLDVGQANTVLTATVSGIINPTYAWTFSGLQTNPVASTTVSQTITAAQFGTSKSATVTCTVNGTYADTATIVRLEKSTAAAGATVGATWGVNVVGGKEYVASRGENLVTNGTGLLKDNTNFSSFTFNATDAFSSAGSFVDSTASSARYSDELIPVNTNLRYELSLAAKCNPYVGAYFYAGIACYDVDGLHIDPYYCMYTANTLTTLELTLVNGATTITLTNSANWLGNTTNLYQRSIIFWNYVNAGGYAWPELTYSRNWFNDLWAVGGINGNVITLKTPWAGGTIPAGTKLSNGNAGGTFIYCTMSNVAVPAAWTTYSGTVGGVDLTGTNDPAKFRPGTASVKLLFLNNRNVAGSTVWYSNISFGNGSYANATALAAQAASTSALAALTNIASDNILSPSEKPTALRDYTALVNERAGIDAQATAYGITTEKAAYDTAVDTLTTYLGTLSGWATIPGVDVAINGVTFRTKFLDAYSTKQALLNKIAAVAGTTAAWSGVASVPSNLATAGASPATSVLNSAITLDANGTLSGGGASSQVSLTNIPGTLQATHLAALTMAAGSSITAGTASDGVVLDASNKRLSVFSAGVERIRLGYGIGVGAAYGLQIKNLLGKVMLDTADGVLMRGDIVQDNYSMGDATTGGVDSTFGSHNLAIGAYALSTAGGVGKQENIAVGTEALKLAASAAYNIAVGTYALKTLTTGASNVAVGASSGTLVDAKNFNTALGDGALAHTGGAFTSVGEGNTALGAGAMELAASNACADNTAVGYGAGKGITSARNVAIGFNTGIGLGGDENTLIGSSAGNPAGLADRNVLLGYGAGANLPTTARAVVIVGSHDGLAATNNSITLSDGDGNIRATVSAAGYWSFKGQMAAPSLLASGTGGIGYATGAGGAVAQATSKATGVTLNKTCGKITLNAASLAAGAVVSFTLTNSTIAASDVVTLCIASSATAGAYLAAVDAVAAGSCRISLRNMSAAALSEAVVLNFAVMKAVAA